MSGKIKKTIDYIIQERAHGITLIENTTKTKLILKGINVDKYSSTSEDDPEVLEKLKAIAQELGVSLENL